MNKFTTFLIPLLIASGVQAAVPPDTQTSGDMKLLQPATGFIDTERHIMDKINENFEIIDSTVSGFQDTLDAIAVDTTTIAGLGGGGAASLSVGGGSLQDYVQGSSPTSHINFATGPFVVTLISPTSAFVTIDYSSITAQGKVDASGGGTEIGFRSIFSTNVVTNSDGGDTVHPLLISTNTMQLGTTAYPEFLSASSGTIDRAVILHSTFPNQAIFQDHVKANSMTITNQINAGDVEAGNLDVTATAVFSDANDAITAPNGQILGARDRPDSSPGFAAQADQTSGLGFYTGGDLWMMSSGRKLIGTRSDGSRSGVVIGGRNQLRGHVTIGTTTAAGGESYPILVVTNVVGDTVFEVNKDSITVMKPITSQAINLQGVYAIYASTGVDTGHILARGSGTIRGIIVSTTGALLGGTTLQDTVNINGVLYQWPSADGSDNQRLTTNGSGVLTWETVSSGGGGGGGGFVFDGSQHVAFSTLSYSGATITFDGTHSSITFVPAINSTFTASMLHGATAQIAIAALATDSTTIVQNFRIWNDTGTPKADFINHTTTADIKDSALDASTGSLSVPIIIQDEGTDLSTATVIDFVGAGVTVTNTESSMTVTIAGGGSSGEVFGYISTRSIDMANLYGISASSGVQIGTGTWALFDVSSNPSVSKPLVRVSTGQDVLFEVNRSSIRVGVDIYFEDNGEGVGEVLEDHSSTLLANAITLGQHNVAIATTGVHLRQVASFDESTGTTLSNSTATLFTNLKSTAIQLTQVADFAASSASILSVSTDNLKVLITTKAFAVAFDSPTLTTDFPIFQNMLYDISITSLSIICSSGTSMTGGLYELDGTGVLDASEAIASNITVTCGTQESVVSFTNFTVDAGDWIAWFTDSVSGIIDKAAMTVLYTVAYPASP